MESRDRETKTIRKWAETIRNDLKTYEARGGSPEAFLPRVRRAQRHVRKGDLDGALRILKLVETDLRTRLGGKDS